MNLLNYLSTKKMFCNLNIIGLSCQDTSEYFTSGWLLISIGKSIYNYPMNEFFEWFSLLPHEADLKYNLNETSWSHVTQNSKVVIHTCHQFIGWIAISTVSKDCLDL